MPQLAQIAATYASQAFWLLIVFGIIYFVIARGAVTRVGSTIDARAAKIAADLAAARQARDTAADAERDADAKSAKARAEAVKLVSASKSAAAADAAARVKTVDGELTAKIDAASAALGAAADAAMGEVRGAALSAAGDIVERLTGKAADAKLLGAAVDSAIR